MADKCPPVQAVTPQEAYSFFSQKLTTMEQSEIFEFPQIFFIGANAKKTADTTEGYVYVPHDHIAYRYYML